MIIDRNTNLVAVIEDDNATRDGLRVLIEGTAGFKCSGAYRSIEQAIASQGSMHDPDVVLADIQLPGISGVEGVSKLRDKWPKAVVVMLTSFSDDDKIFRSICNGASGYLLKKTPPARLLESIREAREGGAPMTPEVARRVIELFRTTTPATGDNFGLAPQEVRLLALLAQGHTYQAAADSMFVSVNTVRNYIRSVYDKLHVHSKSQAVSKAIKAGIIRP